MINIVAEDETEAHCAGTLLTSLHTWTMDKLTCFMNTSIVHETVRKLGWTLVKAEDSGDKWTKNEAIKKQAHEDDGNSAVAVIGQCNDAAEAPIVDDEYHWDNEIYEEEEEDELKDDITISEISSETANFVEIHPTATPNNAVDDYFPQSICGCSNDLETRDVALSQFFEDEIKNQDRENQISKVSRPSSKCAQLKRAEHKNSSRCALKRKNDVALMRRKQVPKDRKGAKAGNRGETNRN